MAKEQRYTKGRAATATTMGVYHSAVAGKKGKKLRATGRTFAENYVGTVGGQLAGMGAGAALTRGKSTGAMVGGSIAGGAAGGAAGAYHAFRSNNKKGYYKKQPASKFKKNDGGTVKTDPFGVGHIDKKLQAFVNQKTRWIAPSLHQPKKQPRKPKNLGSVGKSAHSAFGIEH